MRETTSNGAQKISMPRDRQKGAEKLAGLSALAATREWERAALIALLVKKARPGRKRATSSANDRYSINEFTRLGIYGFRRHESVRAYLKAWEISGLPIPEYGDSVILPLSEFPEASVLYGRSLEVEDGPEDDQAEGNSQGEVEDGETDGDAEEEPAAPSAGTSRRGGTSGGNRAGSDPVGRLLSALDHTDPVGLAAAASDQAQVELFLKTTDSWLESFREAAREIYPDIG